MGLYRIATESQHWYAAAVNNIMDMHRQDFDCQLQLGHAAYPDQQNEFYFSDEEEQKQERKSQTYIKPVNKKRSFRRKQISREVKQEQGQHGGNYHNKAQSHKQINTAKQSQQSIMSSLSTSMLGTSHQHDQLTMRKAEELLDQQLQQYITRSLQQKAHSEQSQRSACSTKISKIKHNNKLQPQIQTLSTVSNSSRKKRAFINEKLIQNAAELFEKRKKNPLINLQSIAQKINVGYTTICKLYKEWNQDCSLLNRKTQIQTPKAKQMELDQLRMRVLQEVIYLNPYLQQSEMMQKMNQYPQIRQTKSITRYIIYQLLSKAGYDKRRSRRLQVERNKLEANQERKYFCRMYKEVMSKAERNVFFLGELVLNIYNVRDQGWCKQDEEMVIRCPLAKSKSISAVFIICKNGSFISQVKVGILQTQDFYLMVSSLIKQIEPSSQSDSNYLIVDAANLQTEINVCELGSNTNCQIVRVPANSAQLSIIQYFFYQLKSKLKNKKFSDEFHLKQQLQKIIKLDQTKGLASYFQRTELHTAEIIRESDC